ncbi:MAG: CarD family transcriptional regulator, partial [bacterium]|nr:CarD family transcriptional regulator [bacterium]
ADAMVIIDEPTRVIERAEAIEEDIVEQYKSRLSAGEILPSLNPQQINYKDLIVQIEKHSTMLLSMLPKRPAAMRIDHSIEVFHKAPPKYFGQMEMLKKDLLRYKSAGYRIIVLALNNARQQEIKLSFEREDIECSDWDLAKRLPPIGRIGIAIGEISEGIELPDLKLLVITETEMLARGRRRRAVRQRNVAAEGARLASYRDLAVGDYVVHAAHGIGRYLGIATMEISAVQRDYIQIQYNGEDKLYVPTDQTHLIQKYVGAEGKVPKLYSLGGGDWAKVKSRVKESIESMAKELIALYAEREALPGVAISPDTPWQLEMEDNFPFQETPDQLSAIAQVKVDMEAPKAMERLLCGDVGYGKTEVAVRAAFKAVLDGKQVAILVPTTVLAQQHYHTFKERYAGFPVEVALLSRFRSVGENKETARRIAAGLVDV